MKTCPICKCLAFDDARICFGCMHPFESDRDDNPQERTNRAGDVPSRFVVSFVPSVEGGRTVWSCEVVESP